MGGVEQTLPAVVIAGALDDIAFVEQLFQHPPERLFGNPEHVEQVGHFETGIAVDKVQHPMVGAAETEGLKLNITDDAVETIAKFATSVNEQTENIGARRLHTILEKVLDELSFEASDLKKKNVKVDAAYVNKQLADIVKNQDLSRYIL